MLIYQGVINNDDIYIYNGIELSNVVFLSGLDVDGI